MRAELMLDLLAYLVLAMPDMASTTWPVVGANATFNRTDK
jgi:hypothetical protein